MLTARAVLTLLLVALALTAACAQSVFKEVAIWAEVTKVDRGKAFPEVALTLKVTTSMPAGYAGKTITIKPLYARDQKGRVYYDAAATRANMAAYYLLPGDAISARARRRADGSYDATDIKRLPCGQSPPASEELKPMELKTDQTSYSPGEPVRISLVVTNTTRQPVTYQFSSSQQYDFWALRDGREIWRWSRDKFFAQMLTSLTLKPGESKTFAQTWNLRDNSGQPAPDGAYIMMGQLTTMGERPEPVSKTITLGLKPVAKPITAGVSEICANPDAYLGKTVSVSAVYYGWQPPAGIPGSDMGPPVTRSDWAISDGKACLYATGLNALDPINDMGKNVRVRAKVERTEKGQLYLRAEEVRQE